MELKALDLHHYGIIAGICDELGLEDKINDLAKSNPQRKISIGTCVKAMIINGMGYTTRPMYLTHQFYEAKPIEHLLGEGIVPSDLNDDTLGRALDQLFENDCTKIFSHIALNAAKQYGVDTKFRHFDTTNMQVHGEYENQDKAMEYVSFGYAKHGRIDLKQFLISMMVSNDGGIPLFSETIPGNTSDSVHFREVLETMQKNIIKSTEKFYAIIDSAFYCEEAVKLNVLWISPAPERIKLATELKKKYADLLGMIDINEDYKIVEVPITYGEVDQRWVVVYSKPAHKRALKSIDRLVKKERGDVEKLVRKAQSIEYSCKEDAKKAALQLEKKLKYHKLQINSIEEQKKFLTRGKPSEKSLSKLSFYLNLKIVEDNERIERDIVLDSMFILATNELDSQDLPAEEILSYYKEQSKVEQGFRFLKDPLCLASSVYLKNEKRIVALAMIMCLCLLVYSLAERKIRKALIDTNQFVPDQKGKPTQKPTMRWIFQMFEGVIIASLDIGRGIQNLVLNLTDHLKQILRLLGDLCMRIYLINNNASN